MFVSAANLTRGMRINIEGWPCVVANVRHVKYGKGAPIVQVEVRSVLSGTASQIQLHPMKRIERIDLVTRRMRYLRSDGDSHIFSDVASDEEVAIPNALLGEDARWLKEDDVWRILYLNGELFAALPPIEALASSINTFPAT